MSSDIQDLRRRLMERSEHKTRLRERWLALGNTQEHDVKYDEELLREAEAAISVGVQVLQQLEDMSPWDTGRLTVEERLETIRLKLKELIYQVVDQRKELHKLREELLLIREAAGDLTLSDGAVRAVAAGTVPPTQDDIDWARRVVMAKRSYIRR